MTTYHDYPFDEITSAAAALIKKGATLHQKFSCDKCDQRLTVEEPNVFHASGTCDRCGHITNIRKRGCNYLLVTTLDDLHNVMG